MQRKNAVNFQTVLFLNSEITLQLHFLKLHQAVLSEAEAM